MIFTMLFATQSVVFTMIFVTVWVFRNNIRYVICHAQIFALLFALLWVPENDIRYVIHFVPIFALLFASERIYIHLKIFQESTQYRRLELGRL